MSFAITAVAMSASGAVSGAVGSYWSAKNTKVQLEGQARLSDINGRIADINGRIAELGAQQELIRGNQEVAAVTLQAGQLKSRQRATMAANGVDLGEGNAAEIQASTDLMKEIDMNTVTANAVRSAWGYRTQAVNARGEAVNAQNDALMKRASAGALSPGMSATSSLLGSAGSVASTFYTANKNGAFNAPSNG